MTDTGPKTKIGKEKLSKEREKEFSMMETRRRFLGKLGLATGIGAAGISSLPAALTGNKNPLSLQAPQTKSSPVDGPNNKSNIKAKITWKLQTYASRDLAKHVIQPSIDAFNRIAGDQMQILLYFEDELFQGKDIAPALKEGELNAVQIDDNAIAPELDISIFSGYFPFICRYSLDIPVLFNRWGLKEIWSEAYSGVKGVTWLGSGAWDPCHLNTVKKITSVDDLNGLRIFTFPTMARFLKRFGVRSVNLPFDSVEPALKFERIDGTAWSGITENYALGWSETAKYFLSNSIAGAWCGSYFANSKSWDQLPKHLQELFKVCMDSSHYYRLHWYWGNEALLRINGEEHEATSLPFKDWNIIKSEVHSFWEEIAGESERNRRVIDILNKYDSAMEKIGYPYRSSF